jgi:hypothetical protein
MITVDHVRPMAVTRCLGLMAPAAAGPAGLVCLLCILSPPAAALDMARFDHG